MADEYEADFRAYAESRGMNLSDTWRWGMLCRWGSAWIGVHWSPYNRRWCINVIPFVTVWVTLPGGKAP